MTSPCESLSDLRATDEVANPLDNAIKFTPRHGAVEVRIEEHTLGPSIRVPEAFARQLNASAAPGVRDFGVALERVA